MGPPSPGDVAAQRNGTLPPDLVGGDVGVGVGAVGMVAGLATPPPPGFAGTADAARPMTPLTGTTGASSPAAAERHGAALRRAEGTCSAPPPPGFGAAPDQRILGVGGVGPARTAMTSLREHGGGDGGGGTLVASRAAAAAAPSHPHLYPPSHPYRPALLRPYEIVGGSANAAASGPGVTDEEDHHNKERTTSFANLAAALGEGLAESMESSLDRQQKGIDSEWQVQRSSLAQAASSLPAGPGQGHSAGSKPSLLSASTSPMPGGERAGVLDGHSARFSAARGGDAAGAMRIPAASPLLSKEGGRTPSTLATESMTSPSPSVSMHSSSRSTQMSLYANMGNMGPLNPSPLGGAPTMSRAHPQGHGISGAMAEEEHSGATSLAATSAAMNRLTLSGAGGVGHNASGDAAASSRPMSATGLPPRHSPTVADGDSAAVTAAQQSQVPHHLVTTMSPSPSPFSTGGGGGGGPEPGTMRAAAAEASAAYLQGHHRSMAPADGGNHHRLPGTDLTSHADFHGIGGAGGSSGGGGGGKRKDTVAAAALSFASARDLAARELAPFVWEIDPSSNRRRSSEFGGCDDGSSHTSSSHLSSHRRSDGRGLVILGASGLHAPDVRSTCEAFGALMSFRHEFRESRGVVFLSYHDLRSARYSAMELAACLEKLASPTAAGRGGQGGGVSVKYCVALHWSSANDESAIALGNMPPSVDQDRLKQMMTSYGAVRSVRPGPNDSTSSSFVVEFYDIQDARQALSELESSQPWGPGVTVVVGPRPPADKKRGQDLLALLARWRHGEQTSSSGRNPSPGLGGHYSSAPSPSASSDSTSPMPLAPDMSIPLGASASNPAGVAALGAAPGGVPGTVAASSLQQPTTQLMIGPDGNYTYVVLNPAGAAPVPQHIQPPPPQVAHVTPYGMQQQQHVVHGPHGTYVTTIPAALPQPPPPQVHHHPGGQPYIIHHHPAGVPHHPPHHAQVPQYHQIAPGTVIAAAPPPPYVGGHHPAAATMPIYASAAPGVAPGIPGNPQYVLQTHPGAAAAAAAVAAAAVGADGGAAAAGGQHRRGAPVGAPQQQQRGTASAADETAQQQQLLLDIDSVRCGADVRTSLMVRNIPNKYTQQMLLSEFAESGHGTDKMDFFYLPIDFKNRCNRGYAFVNFVDCADIVSFHERYNGKRWKVFNSDKICDITYARIQGKAAMMKRFQNSALMEKDDEYKPLVFVSHGSDKGRKEEFPAPAEAPHSSPRVSSLAAAAKGMH